MKICYNKSRNNQLSIKYTKQNQFMFEMIHNNLMKYNKQKSEINRQIIHNIIFDEKKRIVSIFKDYLLWDEMAEFLKRFYKLKESTSRIPNISEYYVNYTLFAPILYSNEFSISKTMRKYTRRKKRYLEYIEEHEDDFKNKKKNKNKKKENFEPIIKPELVETVNSVNNTAQTIELTQYNNNKEKKMSFSEIFDELSSTINLNKKQNFHLKEKIINFKQTKKFFNNKRLLIESSDLSKPSILNSTLKTKDKNQNSFNIKKLHLKIAKLKELKINYNNLYSNLNTEFNVRNSNNIVLTTISNSERYIPTQSDDLFKEKINRIKQNKINIINNNFFESINKNVANTSRNNNKHHLVLKHNSNFQISIRNNSNENKVFKSTKSSNKNTKKINLNINRNSDNLNFNYEKKRSSRSNGQHNISLKKKYILKENQKTNYPIITINNIQTPNKYKIINDNLKHKSVIKRNSLRESNNFFHSKNNTLNVKRQIYQY